MPAGGHASTPAVPSTLGMLCRAVADCEKHQFKAHLTAPVRALFQNVGPYAPFGLRLVFANLWLFGPLLPLLAGRLGGELGAMMRTTMAFTTAQGSKQINVLPTRGVGGRQPAACQSGYAGKCGAAPERRHPQR